MSKKFIIAGGGTGGHIFPAIAIANALKKQDKETEILFVGAKGKMEMDRVPFAGYKIIGLDIAGFNRSSLIKNLSLPFKLVKSFFQVNKIFSDFKPDGVVGVGGYSSFPVLRYAQAKGIPTFIHESNSFPGKSNVLLGRKASRIFVATDGMELYFPASKISITGNPVRPEITATWTIKKEDAVKKFGLRDDRTTVLAMGGSLGARSINEALHRHIDQFEKNNLQLIWQTGNSAAAKWQMYEKKENMWVGPFITDIQNAYAAADIVVSRSGAIAVAELCIVTKAVVFVPYPFAAEDHQTANAKRLVDKEAALMVADKDAIDQIVPMVIALSNDQSLMEKMKNNIRKEAILNADEHVATEICAVISRNATKESITTYPGIPQ
jgi:UDP-N-acetylglucosamine--N-acetylmuramyl-(pentapeptide) pyrophosphoryl-undecaprenol N-acetylglucosamine transferase